MPIVALQSGLNDLSFFDGNNKVTFPFILENTFAKAPDDLIAELRNTVREGDLVVFLGAGTIDGLARKFGEQEG